MELIIFSLCEQTQFASFPCLVYLTFSSLGLVNRENNSNNNVGPAEYFNEM